MTRRRRVVFTLVTLLLAWPVCEGLAYVGMSLSFDEFSIDSYRRSRELIALGSVSEGAAEVIHPYVGWAFDPRVAAPLNHGGRTIPINKLGFADDHSSIAKRNEDEFIVGIAGGSVAWQTSVDGEEVIRKTLEASPLLGGRKVRLVRMAMSGYKQPQQLMMLNYLLAMGGEFDAVINIDGYNETALTIGENAMADVAIVYPRSWQGRTIAIGDPRESAETAELIALRGKRQSMARFLNGSLLGHSPIANLVWKLRDNSCKTGLQELGMKSRRSIRKPEDRSFASYGPQRNFADEAELDTAVIALWKKCSVLMDHTCKGHGAAYIHVLQANQYHEGSKPMTKKQRTDSVAPHQRAGIAATRLYPQLVKAGPELTQAGVHFSDQTMLFAKITDRIYIDGWCHYNARGNQMMAKAACDELLKALAEKSRAARSSAAE